MVDLAPARLGVGLCETYSSTVFDFDLDGGLGVLVCFNIFCWLPLPSRVAALGLLDLSPQKHGSKQRVLAEGRTRAVRESVEQGSSS